MPDREAVRVLGQQRFQRPAIAKAFRLPREAIEMDFRLVERLGVSFHFDTRVGRDVTFEQLQERLQAQKRLLHDVSHELRSPLARLRVALALAEDYDRQVMIECARLSREIFAQPAFTPYAGEEVFPGANRQSDEELLDFIRRKAETVYHPVGTCRMGNDDEAVVDPSLNVRGIEALSVVDASVMPALVSGNTNAPTIMIAEKFAASL